MPDSPSGLPRWFREAVGLAERVRGQVGVVLVANVKGRTQPMGDFDGDSLISEFLSSEELDDLVTGFEEAGIYCEPVVDEDGFLQWLTTGRWRFPRPIPIVYNLAQNGTGPARLSMIAGLCRLYGLAMLDSDAHAVAVSQHKFHVQCILAHIGLPIAPTWWFTPQGWFPAAPPFGTRLIAKPTFESASIGIGNGSVFTMDGTADERIRELASQYRQPFTIQEFIPGFEVEIPIFESDTPQTLLAVGLSLHGERTLNERLLTYDDVFADGYGFFDFAEEQPHAAHQAILIAKKSFLALGFTGVARVDFRIRLDGRPQIMETASKPHLTRHGSVAFAVRNAGGSESELLKCLVGLTMKRLGVVG